jgi:uncharacterized LabA/DUF88 family protein
MISRKIRRVGLFVDWNTQILACPSELSDRPIDRCQFALRRVGKIASRKLCELEPSTVFRVRIRLYHGWTTGFTQTPNRRAFLSVPEFLNPDEIFPSARVLSLSDIEFGDRLIDALPERENSGLRIHLPNTFRRQRGDAERTEKMVDTALAADLLSWARSDADTVALVFSSDDDMVPPVFVAESWMKPMGGSVHLFRGQARDESRFLKLEGLLA